MFFIRQMVSMARARDIDFAFFKDVLCKDGTPEYNGYNTRHCRETGMAPAPKSAYTYLPLMNMKPTDPTTVLTSITKGLQVTRDTNQNILVITADAAIYKIIVDISFYQHDLLSDMVPILGGLHFIMDFVGCIGTLTADCGLRDVLCSAFGSVDKMLSGKKYPQNVRALRLLVEELLRPILEDVAISSMDELEKELEERSSKSRTTKLWVDCVIRPVFLIMLYCRASHESDWLLQLKATEMMLPYMFAAHKPNYSRYGLYYVRSMRRLPPDILDQFCKGQQSLHHTAGLWNGQWSDMFIETTWMRKGHGPGGIIGNTENPETMATWVYSMDAVMTLTGDLKRMGDDDEEDIKDKHKEEFPGRINKDAEDRRAIQHALVNYINPLDPNSHVNGSLLNIVTGKIATPDVNVDQAVEIGTNMLIEFEDSWPEGFVAPISKKIVTLAEKKKSLNVAGQEVMDPDAIYNRALGLLASDRDFEFDELLSTEMAVWPPSMFNPDGTMRKGTKSDMKTSLQVDIPLRHIPAPTALVVDVSALFWTIAWPTNGTVETFLTRFKSWTSDRLADSDVYLCFDRYHDYSIKGCTRESRMASRVYQLSPQTPLPPREAVLGNYRNKIQLNRLVRQHILSDDAYLNTATTDHTLVVTCDESVPIQVYRGLKSPRRDISSKLEEADNFIAQHVVALGRDREACIHVIADDTDVFVLMVSKYGRYSLQAAVFMKSPVFGRRCADIKATYVQHRDIAADLPAVHALSGVDSVAATFGIGKTTVLKVAKMGYRLNLLGDKTADITQVIKQATDFMAACYGVYQCSSMTDCRKKIWARKSGTLLAKPKLCSLPCTTEAFHENVLRARLQLAIWDSSESGEPPDMDPVMFGWEADLINKSLTPRNMCLGTPYAPWKILDLIRCGCGSEKSCKGGNCGCTKRQMPCTLFCSCAASWGTCHNPFNKTDDEEDNLEHDY